MFFISFIKNSGFVKNKMAPPFKTAEFDIIFGYGISKEGCLLDMAVQYDVVQKSGAWFSYNGEKIGQGKENTKGFLANNPDIYAEIEAKVKDAVKNSEK